MHEDGHVREAIVVINNILQINTCFSSAVVRKVVGSICIELLVGEHRKVVPPLDCRICNPTRFTVDPFFVHRLNHHFCKCKCRHWKNMQYN